MDKVELSSPISAAASISCQTFSGESGTINFECFDGSSTPRVVSPRQSRT